MPTPIAQCHSMYQNPAAYVKILDGGLYGFALNCPVSWRLSSLVVRGTIVLRMLDNIISISHVAYRLDSYLETGPLRAAFGTSTPFFGTPFPFPSWWRCTRRVLGLKYIRVFRRFEVLKSVVIAESFAEYDILSHGPICQITTYLFETLHCVMRGRLSDCVLNFRINDSMMTWDFSAGAAFVTRLQGSRGLIQRAEKALTSPHSLLGHRACSVCGVKGAMKQDTQVTVDIGDGGEKLSYLDGELRDMQR